MVDGIRTEEGTVEIDHEEGRLVITFSPTEGNNVKELRDVDALMRDDGSCVVTYQFGKRHPRKGEEVTQNGSSFEVADVRQNGTGYDLLNGNTGVWEKWIES